MTANVYRDGQVHVRAEVCDHCLLSGDRLVSGARARELIAQTRSTLGGSFICHRGQVTDDGDAICRAWFDRYAKDDPILWRRGAALNKLQVEANGRVIKAPVRLR